VIANDPQSNFFKKRNVQEETLWVPLKLVLVLVSIDTYQHVLRKKVVVNEVGSHLLCGIGFANFRTFE